MVRTVLFCALLLCSSCAGSIPISLLCNEQSVEIYVNDEFVGYGLVNYVVPKDVDYITVSCRSDGQILYERNYKAKDYKNRLIEITPQNNYRYVSRNSKEN